MGAPSRKLRRAVSWRNPDILAAGADVLRSVFRRAAPSALTLSSYTSPVQDRDGGLGHDGSWRGARHFVGIAMEVALRLGDGVTRRIKGLPKRLIPLAPALLRCGDGRAIGARLQPAT